MRPSRPASAAAAPVVNYTLSYADGSSLRAELLAADGSAVRVVVVPAGASEAFLRYELRVPQPALPAGAAIKVVEAPPGPPVMATLLAEVYGPDAQTRRAVAERVKATFHSVPYIVDIDDSYGQPRPGLRLVPDRDRLEALKVSDREVYDSVAAARL